MQQGDDNQRESEGVGPSSGPGARRDTVGSQNPGLKRASSESEHPSLSKMSQNARESMGVLGQGLKQLFQQQRKRLSLSRSTTTSSSSSSSSSVVSAGGTSPSAPEDASGSCCPDSDCLSAPVVPSAAGQGSVAAGTMRRGTSLQSRRSKGSGSGSGDRDPLLRGSPQAPRRRYTTDPQQHISRPRSSSTTDTTPSSPAPGNTGSDVVLSSGYQSTEETDRALFVSEQVKTVSQKLRFTLLLMQQSLLFQLLICLPPEVTVRSLNLLRLGLVHVGPDQRLLLEPSSRDKHLSSISAAAAAVTHQPPFCGLDPGTDSELASLICS
ncbi:unnamed protein product [Pleuronectes platessa]|uniref:Uncharacterized protein n=1 Tax=Pleuronectes platessa TaxID=8262 RepID=A0A9N7UZI4_PLEPL|nr:unnamed protein product [Pleuronectes platessa]